MTSIPPLSALGSRICILGPSNSGKSTLAVAISQKTGLPAIHIDQLHHLPNTHWKPREEQEFLDLHECAIQQNQWVMDGNYSRCMQERFARATGIIFLQVPTYISLGRYIRRCFSRQYRYGGLEGGKDRINMKMLKFLLVTTPAKRKSNHQRFDEIGLPKVMLDSRELIQAAYQQWQLEVDH